MICLLDLELAPKVGTSALFEEYYPRGEEGEAFLQHSLCLGRCQMLLRDNPSQAKDSVRLIAMTVHQRLESDGCDGESASSLKIKPGFIARGGMGIRRTSPG